MMIHRMKFLQVSVVAAITLGLLAPVSSARERFSLVRAVPDGVFICTAGRANAERKFVDDYWDDVFEALNQTGVGTDVMELIGSLLGEEQRAEVDRLKALATRVLDGVDWDALSGGEMVFAEQLGAPKRIGETYTMIPDIVWMARGTQNSAPANYEGLVAILNAIASEVNKAAGTEVLVIETTSKGEAKVSRVNVLRAAPNAPAMPIAVALRNDVVIITMGDEILDKVLGLLSGDRSVKSLRETARFKRAFKNLPAAEDELSFFDMQVMLKSIRGIVNLSLDQAGKAGPKDAVTNAYGNEKANILAAKGVEAYQQKDYKKALSHTIKAHDVDPTDSRIMYNLACFHAMLGNKKEALDWLGKSVDAGFHAPNQISHDSDLDSLRDAGQYKAALATAKKKAPQGDGSEEQIGHVKKIADRVFDLPGMIDHIASVSYTDGYSVHKESVTRLVADAADKPFYPVFGKRKPRTGFDRYLPKETTSFSVGSGIDLAELNKFIEDTVRVAGSDGEELLSKWAAFQETIGVNVKKDVLDWIQGDTAEITMNGPEGESWVFMVKVADEELARAKSLSVLNFLSTKLQALAQENPMLAMMAIRTSEAAHEKLSGFSNIYIGMSPQPIVFGVTDGHLIFGSSADAIALCLATAAGDHPTVRENAQLMKEALIPDGAFVSVSFKNERKFGEQLTQAVAVVSMVGGMAAMAVPEPEAQKAITKVLGIVAKLGPLASKIDFYRSTAEYETFDGRMWRSRSVTNYAPPKDRGVRADAGK